MQITIPKADIFNHTNKWQKLWNEKFNHFLLFLGFVSSKYDYIYQESRIAKILTLFGKHTTKDTKDLNDIENNLNQLPTEQRRSDEIMVIL